jgi:hypothetical protein
MPGLMGAERGSRNTRDSANGARVVALGSRATALMRKLMAYRASILAVLCMAICSCSPDGPPIEFNPENPGLPHQLQSDTDAGIADFANKHAGERIIGLNIRVGAMTAKGFSYLSQLKGLYALSLGNTAISDKNVKQYEIYGVFNPLLSDDQVLEIAKIRSLRVLYIWYGSLTGQQRALLRTMLPECKISENINKL